MGEQQRGVISDKMIDRVFADSRLNGAGFVMPAPHCHPYFELFYSESGACSFFTGSNMFDLHAGDMILIPPEVFHYTRYPAGACKRSNVFFRRGDLDARTASLLPGGESFLGETRILRVPEAFRGQVSGLVARMIRENRISDSRSALLLEMMLNELLLLLARECDGLCDLPDAIHTTDSQIVRAAQFMGEHYMEDISMADIASAAGYSPNYLSRKFREAAGIGVHEYLVFVRLQRAALELVTTDDFITDIALRCGFSDGNYFKDAFKKKYGVTPREYRK